MQSSSSFVERIMGAMKLDPATYEDVEHDEGANGQAVIIVVAVTILSGLAVAGSGNNRIIGSVVSAILGWAVFTLAAYLVGTTILKGPNTSATFGGVFRALGFAYAPSLFSILGLIPGIGGLIAFVVAIWSLAASVVALRQSLDVTTGRAIGIAIVAVIAIALVLGLVAAVLGIGVVAVDSIVQSA